MTDWQPMDTAPKGIGEDDFVLILVWDGYIDRPIIVHWSEPEECWQSMLLALDDPDQPDERFEPLAWAPIEPFRTRQR